MLQDDLRGIIGFEIVIDELQAASKLSQNRDAESYNNIIENLSHGDAAAQKVGEAMKAIKPQLFINE